MKVSELIKELEDQMKEHGDKDIIFSSDEEGNALMDTCHIQEDGGQIVIFPYNYI